MQIIEEKERHLREYVLAKPLAQSALSACEQSWILHARPCHVGPNRQKRALMRAAACRCIQSNYSRIKDVERELSGLQMQLKLSTGPKKSALMMIRKKIELQNERVLAARERQKAAKKVSFLCTATFDLLCISANIKCPVKDPCKSSHSLKGICYSSIPRWARGISTVRAQYQCVHGQHAQHLHSHVDLRQLTCYLQVFEATDEALKEEDAVKERLCNELNMLVQQSAHAQLEKLEQVQTSSPGCYLGLHLSYQAHPGLWPRSAKHCTEETCLWRGKCCII